MLSLDWLGPVDAAPSAIETDQAAVAWTTQAPCLSPGEPHRHLRLFRATYTNPHPDLEVQHIDFMAALSNCAPFLVGVAVQ
jgi:hypothetical protein